MVPTLSWAGGLKAAEDDLARQQRCARRQQAAAGTGTCWIYADEMQGTWVQQQNYPGYLGDWFRASEDGAKNRGPLDLEVGLARAGQYSVWVHALIGGATPDRALATRMNGLLFPASHGEAGPAAGQFTWHKVGEVDLPRGIATVSVQATGRGYAGLDAIVLTQEARWQPPEPASPPGPESPPTNTPPTRP
jgi:hypothetical protein